MTDLETANRISKKVSKKLEELGIPARVSPAFVMTLSLVLKELRREAKKKKSAEKEE